MRNTELPTPEKIDAMAQYQLFLCRDNLRAILGDLSREANKLRESIAHRLSKAVSGEDGGGGEDGGDGGVGKDGDGGGVGSTYLSSVDARDGGVGVGLIEEDDDVSRLNTIEKNMSEIRALASLCRERLDELQPQRSNGGKVNGRAGGIKLAVLEAADDETESLISNAQLRDLGVGYRED